jgi:hypothetical protein
VVILKLRAILFKHRAVLCLLLISRWISAGECPRIYLVPETLLIVNHRR